MKRIIKRNIRNKEQNEDNAMSKNKPTTQFLS